MPPQIASRRNLLARLLCLAALCLFGGAVAPASAEAPLSERLVGQWEVIGGKANILEFHKDGTWKLYLTKGEIGDLRFLNGTWKVTEAGELSLLVQIRDRAQEMSLKVQFEREELVITDPNKKVTRHRQHTGPLPEQFKW